MLAPPNGIELRSRRTLNSKHYDVGSGELVGNFSPGHVHYENKLLVGDGEPGLREIDWTLTEKPEGGWTFLYHSFNPDVPEYADGWLGFRDLFGDKDQTVGFKPVCAHVKGTLVQSIEGLTDVNAVVYPDAFGAGIDYIVYFTRSQMLKCVRIREKEPKDYAFKFELQLPEGVSVWRVGDDVSYELDLTSPKDFDTRKTTELRTANGTTFFNPFKIWDSEKSQVCVVTYSVEDGKIYLTKHVPQAFVDSSVGSVLTDTTTSYYAGAGDGVVSYAWNATWSTVRDASTGTNSYPSTATLNLQTQQNTGSGGYRIERAFFPFDTSGMGSSTAVSSATLYVYVTGGGSTDTDANSFAVPVSESQASPTTLVKEDFSRVGSTKYSDSNLTIGGSVAAGYKSWGLNSSGRSAINNVGTTYLGLREGHCLNNDPVDTGTYVYLTCSFSETTGTSQDPYLSVTYSAVSSAIKTWNGLADASVKSANGLARASVKDKNGLA